MIRQKIVSGPTNIQSNFQNPQNKEINIKQNNFIPQNIPIRNISPNPNNNFQRPLFTNQSETQLHQGKPLNMIQPPKFQPVPTFHPQPITTFNNQVTKVNNSYNQPLKINNPSISIPIEGAQTKVYQNNQVFIKQ